jgi:hypothetical protein
LISRRRFGHELGHEAGLSNAGHSWVISTGVLDLVCGGCRVWPWRVARPALLRSGGLGVVG